MAKTKEATPEATFEATGADSGTLSGLVANASYKISGAGIAETTIAADASGKYTIDSGLVEGLLSIVKKGNGTTTTDSTAQSITVTQAAAPTNLGTTVCTTDSNNDGTITGVTTAMEYKKSGEADYTAVTGTTITSLVPGVYYVRVKAAGTALASPDSDALTIAAYVAPTGYGGITVGDTALTSANITTLLGASATASYNETTHTLTITGDATPTGDVLIPDGVTVVVASGKTLTVPNGTTLTNKGTISGAGSGAGSSGGTLTNAASKTISTTVTNSGTVDNSGTLSGSVTNSGTLTNVSGATIGGAVTNNSGATLTNEGTISGTVTNSGTLTNKHQIMVQRTVRLFQPAFMPLPPNPDGLFILVGEREIGDEVVAFPMIGAAEFLNCDFIVMSFPAYATFYYATRLKSAVFNTFVGLILCAQ